MPASPETVPPTARAVRLRPGIRPQAAIRLPGSKSLTNRALLVASLARGESLLTNVLDCEDSRHLIDAVRRLGVTVERNEAERSARIQGAGGPFAVREGRFSLGNAGTSCRFLTAALAATGGDYVVDGDRRMRERPIADLVRALRSLGADVDAPSGCPPVRIGATPFGGGRVDIAGHVSSQFISAILMAAPLTGKRVDVRVVGQIVSRPYLDLTVDCMTRFGARVQIHEGTPDGHPIYSVLPGNYRGKEYAIEGDASAASYFHAAGAVTGGTVRVEGVGKESLQGDARCADILAAMGCRVTKEREAMTVTGGLLKGVDCDCSEIPDVVPTLAVVAIFAKGRTRLRGVAHLRHKESDRIASVASELRKLGATVRELPDGLEVEGTLGRAESPLHGASIETWGDHRIAMAFSVAGLVLPDVTIRSPQVVEKSFPGFFAALASIGAGIEYLSDPSPGGPPGRAGGGGKP